MFLYCDSSELNMHFIHPEWCLTSDHAPLTVTIFIVEEYIANRKRSIAKNSEEEDEFIKEVITVFANIVDHSWMKHSKLTNITKYSKS